MSATATPAATPLAYEVFYRPDIDDAVICVPSRQLGVTPPAELHAFFVPDEPTLILFGKTDTFVLHNVPAQAWAVARGERGVMVVAMDERAGPVGSWSVRA